MKNDGLFQTSIMLNVDVVIMLGGFLKHQLIKFISSFVPNVLLADHNAIKNGVILATQKGWNKFSGVYDSQNAIVVLNNFPRHCFDLDPLLFSTVNLLPSAGFEGFILGLETLTVSHIV